MKRTFGFYVATCLLATVLGSVASAATGGKLVCQTWYAISKNPSLLAPIGNAFELDLRLASQGNLPLYCDGYKNRREFGGAIGTIVYFEKQKESGELQANLELYHGEMRWDCFEIDRDARLKAQPLDDGSKFELQLISEKRGLQTAVLKCSVESGPVTIPFELKRCPHENFEEWGDIR